MGDHVIFFRCVPQDEGKDALYKGRFIDEHFDKTVGRFYINGSLGNDIRFDVS